MQAPTNWLNLDAAEESATAVNARGRLSLLASLFCMLLIVVFAQAAQLEVRDGDGFRETALKPLRREVPIAATRGRILARDGSPLAEDRRLLALAVHYRYLQSEPDERWLRNQARLRLPKNQRRDQRLLANAQAEMRGELQTLTRRLAHISGLSEQTWRARTDRIEARVEKLAAHVNELRRIRFVENQLAFEEAATPISRPWWDLPANVPDALSALVTPEQMTFEPVIVAEQVDYHIVVEDLPSDVADSIRSSPEEFSGVRVLEVPRRSYPAGSLAANVLGHLYRPSVTDGESEPKTSPPLSGAIGLELGGESTLTGRDGTAIEQMDRRGQLLATNEVQPAINGQDVATTLDRELQRTAEALLDHGLARDRHLRGGAIVVLDIHTGDVLALASGPRFDPNAFALNDADAINSIFSDEGQPLFDRATRMALPPGALFKPFAACAMLESDQVPPQALFHCQGYLVDPESMRCAIYRQQGVGHGEITLSQALSMNCNVFFLHYAGVLGVDPLLNSATQFGFGTLTGIELPNEARGALPTPVEPAPTRNDRWRAGEAQLLALGQGALLVTPIQMARAMAAIGNGGKLVRPRLIAALTDESSPVTGLPLNAVSMISTALVDSVADESGAAHEALSLDTVRVAGMVATGEVAGRAPDHAWCAGFVPAIAPQYAFVVALEHGGDGAKRAAPLAKRLIQRMAQLNFFATSDGKILAQKNSRK